MKLKENPYFKAPEVREVAKSLLNELTKEAKICYLFVNKETKYLGKVKKTSFETKLITGYDYFLFIRFDYWDELASEKQKQALVFHELEHIDWKPSVADPEVGSWVLKKHDIEEFNSVIEKFGAWEGHLDIFKESEIIEKLKEKPDLKISKTNLKSCVNS